MSDPGGPYYQVDPMTGRPVAYQGFGMYPPPPPPRRNRTPLIVTLAVALALVVGTVVTIVVLQSGGTDPVAVPQSTTAEPTLGTTSPRTPSTTPRRTTTSPLPSDARVPASIPGWQGVLSPREKAGYDVPKDWKVETPGTVVGFSDNDDNPSAIMHGTTTYKPEACPNSRGSYRGHTGFVTAGAADPERAAVNGARLFADAAALNPDDTRAPVSTTPPVPVKVANGTIDAVMATATVTATHPGECPSPTVLFTAVAFKNGTSTVLFMMYLDQGVPDALPADIAAQIITTIRPMG
ncbi:hypothetical protein [Actinokineospora terrae]|uniref:DUF8017 domain-containing protein n=1 Tax=Actinokineospora terrae TaxID=155974 RepID=A0A1H9TFF3_9PSEU|nr:hypothetical protein [Actinokineospora terrae]SER95767.1 hypothetical protein SAMN04487818_106243 [Actinokineospora terrae]